MLFRSGIATLKDIRKSRENDKKLMLKDVMNRDVVCVNKDKSIVDVLEVMNIKNVGYIPVVDENKKLLGLITRSSLINVLSGQFLDVEGVGM